MTTDDDWFSIEQPEQDAVDSIAALWVELADGQRAHGSHLLAEANRDRIERQISQHVVAGTVRIARADGSIVGFVTFGLESESYRQAVTRGVVHNIYVVESARNREIGSALLAAAETALSDRGVDAIALEAMAENEAARRFYRRHGYSSHRVEMERQLDREDSTESDTLRTEER
ncbi:MAG: GNAT family N-acetyltransferase [Natronomonas sp.]